MDFGRRWLDVLYVLELPEPTEGDAQGSASGGHRAGGSRPNTAHSRNTLPSIPNWLESHPTPGLCEFALRSADAIDVLFRCNQSWVGVVVKASTSEGNARDYERGLYQIVK
jgi:hypothetical protein